MSLSLLVKFEKCKYDYVHTTAYGADRQPDNTSVHTTVKLFAYRLWFHSDCRHRQTQTHNCHRNVGWSWYQCTRWCVLLSTKRYSRIWDYTMVQSASWIEFSERYRFTSTLCSKPHSFIRRNNQLILGRTHLSLGKRVDGLQTFLLVEGCHLPWSISHLPLPTILPSSPTPALQHYLWDSRSLLWAPEKCSAVSCKSISSVHSSNLSYFLHSLFPLRAYKAHRVDENRWTTRSCSFLWSYRVLN